MFLNSKLHQDIWISSLVSIATICAIMAIGAKLILSGIVPWDMKMVLTCCSLFFGTVPGGYIASGKKKELNQCLFTGLVVYGVIWITALASGQPIHFGTTALTETICIFAGSMIGGMLHPTLKTHKPKPRKRQKKRT